MYDDNTGTTYTLLTSNSPISQSGHFYSWKDVRETCRKQTSRVVRNVNDGGQKRLSKVKYFIGKKSKGRSRSDGSTLISST